MRHMRFCVVSVRSHRFPTPGFAVLAGTAHNEGHASQLYFHQAPIIGTPNGSRRLLDPPEEFRGSLGHLLGYHTVSFHSIISDQVNSRILELADPSKFVALDTSRIVRVTFDLLLAAGNASNSKPLPRLARLRNTPVSVDRLAINDSLAVRPIVVEVADALARDFSLADKSRKEMSAGPNFRSKRVLGRCWAR